MFQHARWIEGLAVVAGFAVLAVACTWPLAAQIGTALPGDLGDPLFSAWVLGWVSERLRAGLSGFWDAPIFFPAKGTLALSEHYFGVAVLVAPVYWLSGNAVATYNAGVLVAYTLAGAGMYLLARSLTGSRPAAVVAGVIFAFAPYRADHLSHLQVLSSGWMPISLWGLHRFLSSGSIGAIATFAGAFAMQALSNGYFLYFLSFASALVILFHLDAVRKRWRVVLPQLAAAAIVILLVLAPFVWAYVRSRAETGAARTYSDLINFSADAASYFVPAGIVRPYRWIPDRWLPGPQIPERQLFPGMAALALAVLAIWKGVGESKRKSIRLYGAIGILGFLLSLGPEPSFWGSRLGAVGPYLVFARVVPGMNGLRAPARSSVLVFLSLSVLAALGASRLFERLDDRRRLTAGAALALVAVGEGWIAPTPMVPFDPRGRQEDRAAYTWLAGQSAGGTLELPILSWSLHPTLTYQFATLLHGHQIVNGYSGYGSGLQAFLGGAGSPLNDLGRINRTLRMLSALGIRFVISHPRDYESPEAGQATLAAMAASDHVARVYDFRTVFVLELKPVLFEITEKPRSERLTPIPQSRWRVTSSHAADRLPHATDGNPDTRWISGKAQSGDEWIQIDLDAPVDVRVLRIRMAVSSFSDYPRNLIVEGSDPQGRPAVLYNDDVLVPLARGIVAGERYPPIDLHLPPNWTQTLRIRQTAATRTWFWSIHELSILE
ncbi:MAG: hypothetical protein EHM89_01330 [Acidobacteria bacterium]|nr:MAG: hypothetical protein EHM89_01330 [Acidobacteriota bacterium]